MKRVFDIGVSAIALILLSPVLLIVMLVLRLTGEGEVFFLQERMGYKNKPFKITKFATMLKSAAFMKSGDYTTRDDPRILPFGKFLRKSKINEIIQLWDVLRGKMSLVGPRPQMLRIHNLYPPEFESVLLEVRPGITGIGSLVYRDEENLLTDAENRHDLYINRIVPHKAALELWYVRSRTFSLDLKLIFITVWQIIFPHSKAVERLLPSHLHRDRFI